MLTCDAMLIETCDFIDTVLSAISIESVTNSALKGCSIAKTGAAAKMLTCDAMLIDTCDFIDTVLSAISIESVTNSALKNCSIAKTGAEGITMLTSDAILIKILGDFVDTALAAISITSSTKTTSR